eukprot:GHVQ01020808.1.p1 GENE.GHVQ01020808.1~~GHVQ01020808.1.p1  ORF type:complete len:152 (-),score=21.68 GHVQ01020808.1:58-513(-)
MCALSSSRDHEVGKVSMSFSGLEEALFHCALLATQQSALVSTNTSNSPGYNCSCPTITTTVVFVCMWQCFYVCVRVCVCVYLRVCVRCCQEVGADNLSHSVEEVLQHMQLHDLHTLRQRLAFRDRERFGTEHRYAHPRAYTTHRHTHTNTT